MQNMIIQGIGNLSYPQCYGGSLSLSQTIATLNLTGTIAINGTSTVTGTTTAFTTELNPGQFVLLVNSGTHKSYLIAVKRIIDDTHFICWQTPADTASGLTGTRLPVIFPVDQDIGTCIFGNFKRLDKGTLLSVGQGVARINGSALSSSLTLTRAPQISIYNSGAGTYTNFTLGMATSAAPTLADNAAGGTKNMQAGTYGVVITPARTATLGFNNPSVPQTVTLAAANHRVDITFPAMDTANGQDGWYAWVTRYADSLGADKNYIEGPWYLLNLTPYTGSSAGFTKTVEWLDGEVEANGLVDFDNFAPPNALFIAGLNNIYLWISCQGLNNSSPGPFIFPAKPNNIEAAPVQIAFASSPPEIIIGAVSAQGRVYLLTANHLEIAQGTPDPDIPVIIRPFWTVGFANWNQLIFVDEVLYGYTLRGPARSVNDGTVGSEKFDFGIPVQEITRNWVPGNVTVALDPQNNAVCFFHACDSLNASGFWTTRVLMFGLRQDAWIGDLTFTSTTQDMIVTGVATVGNFLQMLMGGRLANDSISIGTYTFDQPAGASVPWYVAPCFSDYGQELRAHVVKRIRFTGKATSSSVGGFGAQATESIPVTSLETGNSSSLTGAISQTDSSTVTQYAQNQVNCPNLVQSTVRIEGTYNGTDAIRDQVHEIEIAAAEQGIRN
jgi:hypothetical protein